MEFDQIMRKITAELTGDTKTDLAYLKEQCEVYKEHELNTEIIRAVSRMMFELIPEDAKEEFGKIIGNDRKGIDAAMDEVRFQVQRGDLVKAEKLCEALVKQADEMPMFQNDSVSEYYTFGEFFEEVLYQELNEVERDVRRAEFPFSEIYLLEGSLMMEKKEYLKAMEALEKARRWNPVNCDIAFEYMETFKAVGEMGEFYRLTVESMKYAFRNKDFARALRNLGYYFTEKEEYKVSAACYLLSLEYDRESKNAQSELYYIQTKCNGNLSQPTIEEIEQYGTTYGFPIRISEDVIGIAFGVGKHFAEAGNADVAKYLLTIVQDIVEDENLQKMIDGLN